MWKAALLMFCFMTPTGEVECDEVQAESPQGYVDENICVLMGHLSATHASARSNVPVVSLHVTCQQEKGA